MAVAPESVGRELTDTLLRRQVMLLRLSEAEKAKFLPFLKDMDAELRKRLSGSPLTEFSRARLDKLLKLVDAALADIMSDFSASLLDTLDQVAKDEAAFAGRAVTSVIDVDFSIPAVSQIRAAVLGNPLSIKSGALLEPFIKGWTEGERDAVEGTIRRGVFEGRTNAQIVQSIRGTKAARYTDGLLETTARNARTIVHTAVQHVSAQARQATFEENADVVKGVQWISTLDSHTCQTCRSLDKRIFPRDKGPRSPIHPFCRCTIVPYLGKKYATFLNAGTRASSGDSGGAQVAASLDYYAWLKTQPKGFIEVALGPKRAKLFVEGGLSAERFAAMQLDRQWEPLTLEEMRKLEPIAFERAGL
jgi:SPP1 gp7 family putative phage head morphogenesis protein